jgi:zinc transport system substrate-binding protein
MTIDILVMNGIGHDDFIYDDLNAARIGTNDIIIIRPVTEIPVLRMEGTWYERERIKIENPHTFISIQSSIQQIEYISKKLKMLDSENRDIYDENTERYIKRLEGIKAMYAERISGIETRGFRCAATQASFAYFLQEFGVKTMLIVEPKHGVRHTDSDVRGSILKMKEYNIKVLFSDSGEKNGTLKKICDATGARSYPLTHMTGGEYTADKFEQDIMYNLESLTRALVDNQEQDSREKDNQEQGGATDKM